MERLNKYIATCGVCSRRKADELIQSGKVEVNNIVVIELGYKVEEKDIIKVDGKVISKEEEKVYIMLNKPKGYVTTNSEQFGRKSVLDLIHEKVRIYPIGRLDMYTEGLLLLTNDGEFANRVMHPKNEVDKVYEVTTDKELTKEQVENLEAGVDIGEYVTKKAKVKIISKTKFEITIHEGKNRQVRRMCEATNIKLLNLKRIKEGKITLGDLKTGKYRYLTEEEKNMVD